MDWISIGWMGDKDPSDIKASWETKAIFYEEKPPGI
jgi:hypothetical protein